MINDITIRPATTADMPFLLLFEQGVISAERPFDITIKREFTHYYNLDVLITANYIELLVAKINNEPIGCGYARIEDAKHYLQHTQHAYLGFMYVSPEHRGKGVNKMIIEALIKWTKTKKINEVRLDVYEENLSAIKAYEKVGFTKHMVEMRLGL